MSYHKTYQQFRVTSEKVPEGYRRTYAFPNGFGISVIRHDRGRWEGSYETCMLKQDGDNWVPVSTLVDDPSTVIVQYFSSPETVSRQIRTLVESDGPAGIDVLWAAETADIDDGAA